MTVEEVGASGSERVPLPRRQIGAPPQHLLVTLLGDYWYGHTEPLPSAALVDLLAEFDVSTTGARAALSRLVRRGLLVTSKRGRRTYHRLTDQAAELLRDGLRRILSFGAGTATAWDGSWTVAVFSVPEEQRDLRHALRSQLRWRGFAPLYDGTWVSPRAASAEVTEILRAVGIDSATVFVARVADESPPGGDPLRAWDLDTLRRRYDAFTTEHAPLLARVRDGMVGAGEALLARTAIMDTWREFPNLDPELPASLLPQPWPRDEARRLFVDLYDALGPLAERRVRELVGRYAPDLVSSVRHHATGDSPP